MKNDFFMGECKNTLSALYIKISIDISLQILVIKTFFRLSSRNHINQ